MAVIRSGATTDELTIDPTFKAALIVPKPIGYGTLGHYRVNHRCALVANQAANSRIFELRNGGSNLIVPTRLVIKWLQTAAHTAAIEDSLDVFRCTSFST